MLNITTFMIRVICGNNAFKYVCEWQNDKSLSELAVKAEQYHYQFMKESEGYIEGADDDITVTGIEIHALEGVDIPDSFLV